MVPIRWWIWRATPRPRPCDSASATPLPGGVDVVIDPVGGAVGEAAMRCLSWNGRHVVVGFTAGSFPSFRGNYLLVKNISVSGLQWTDYRDRQIEAVRQAQARIFQLWLDCELAPKISRILPMERVVEGLALLREGKARGRIIAHDTQRLSNKTRNGLDKWRFWTRLQRWP